MMGRNRRGNRRANMKARIGIATAVLIGGGAAGVAVAASHNNAPASTTASDAGFIMNIHHHMGEEAALSSALSMWGHSHQRSLNTLAQMVPMRTFTQVWSAWHHHQRTMYAAQRGVVVLATKQFLVVKSANGGLHLWWLSGATAFQNVTASPTGMTAMTGNNTAAVKAVVNQNMTTASTVMAGSTNAVTQAAAPTKTTTVTITTGTETITITITPTAAMVSSPGATPTGMPTVTMTPSVSASPSMSVAPTASATPTVTPSPTTTATQPVTTATHGVAAGDLVMVTGVRVHGRLWAKLVLFSAPTAMTGTPTATPSVSVSATATSTARPTVTPTVSGTSATFSGTKS